MSEYLDGHIEAGVPVVSDREKAKDFYLNLEGDDKETLGELVIALYTKITDPAEIAERFNDYAVGNKDDWDSEDIDELKQDLIGKLERSLEEGTPLDDQKLVDFFACLGSDPVIQRVDNFRCKKDAWADYHLRKKKLK